MDIKSKRQVLNVLRERAKLEASEEARAMYAQKEKEYEKEIARAIAYCEQVKPEWLKAVFYMKWHQGKTLTKCSYKVGKERPWVSKCYTQWLRKHPYEAFDDEKK